MQINYKNQDFQIKAAQSVVNIFKGQPPEDYLFFDNEAKQQSVNVSFADDEYTYYGNALITVPYEKLLSNVRLNILLVSAPRLKIDLLKKSVPY